MNFFIYSFFCCSSKIPFSNLEVWKMPNVKNVPIMYEYSIDWHSTNFTFSTSLSICISMRTMAHLRRNELLPTSNQKKNGSSLQKKKKNSKFLMSFETINLKRWGRKHVKRIWNLKCMLFLCRKFFHITNGMSITHNSLLSLAKYFGYRFTITWVTHTSISLTTAAICA